MSPLREKQCVQQEMSSRSLITHHPDYCMYLKKSTSCHRVSWKCGSISSDSHISRISISSSTGSVGSDCRRYHEHPSGGSDIERTRKEARGETG